ncbi:TPA: hypothetical protein DHW51_17595 [Candidatus Poribacteria bacterium]|nr:hypothetical protein [Candidatus Poribacteria bacterium]|tara:strand:- start:704 stop:1543 length:840 start_codon:yes stop_codon:yes gene_type:complete
MVSRSPTGRKNQFKLKNKQILFLTVFGFISSFTLISYANSYYPVTVGNKWVFHRDNGKDHYTIKVTTSEEAANRIEVQRPGAGGPKGQRPGAGDPKGQQRLPADIQQGSVRVISTQNNETSVSTRFIVTQPDGIRQVLLVLRDAPAVGNQRLGGGVFTFNPPQDFVPNPIHLGSKWISSNNDGVIKIKTERKVVKVETVTVPAGTFQRCLKISEDVVVTRGNNQKRNLSYMWLAKNVGPVKLINPDEEVFQLAEYNTVLAVKKRDQHLSAVWGRVKSRF